MNIKNKIKIYPYLLLLIICVVFIPDLKAQTSQIESYNVIWKSPSTDASGQMPLGNGDIAAGVYAIENGDLYLLLSKNDAYTYCGDIFKTGRVKISISSNPFATGKTFKQIMDMKTGSIQIEAGEVKIRVWADANHPVYHVEIESPDEIEVNAEPELWKRFGRSKYNLLGLADEGIGEQYTSIEPTQDIRIEKNGQIIWYYAVGDQSVFKTDMEYYGVEDMIEKYPDPFIHNTFGNLLESPDLRLNKGILTGKGKQFDIRIHALAKQTPEISDWINEIEQQTITINTKKDWTNHREWWSDFWAKSWVFISDNNQPSQEKVKLNGEGYKSKRTEIDGAALVTQSYNVFRYLMACQSRGKVQTKFNGGLFTQPLRSNEENKWKKIVTQQTDGTSLSHEDSRDWGRRFTFQNQRLLYWPMIYNGDFELMKPFFTYYFSVLPVRKAITKEWFEHEGAYYRENIEPTGAERDNGRNGKPPKTKPGENIGDGYYHSYYFTSGLEIVTMMIEYVKYSGDSDFQKNTLVPFAREILLFFDKHYPRDKNGMLKIDPAMVLETFWIAVNPAPDIAGIQFCLDELIKMDAGANTDKTEWQRFRTEIPPVSLHEIDGRKAIAPAQKYEMKKNTENGELYPVFPFSLFGVSQGTEDIVSATMENRTAKNSFDYKCWTQDQIHWAYAGKSEEAKEGLIHRFRHASTQCRFPVYGSHGPDSCPDFDHFGAGSIALQRMLMQCEGNKIILLPAWPKDWDADFKLFAPYNTTIEGSVKNGKIENLKVTPESRRKDLIIKSMN